MVGNIKCFHITHLCQGLFDFHVVISAVTSYDKKINILPFMKYLINIKIEMNFYILFKK